MLVQWIKALSDLLLRGVDDRYYELDGLLVRHAPCNRLPELFACNGEWEPFLDLDQFFLKARPISEIDATTLRLRAR